MNWAVEKPFKMLPYFLTLIYSLVSFRCWVRLLKAFVGTFCVLLLRHELCIIYSSLHLGTCFVMVWLILKSRPSEIWLYMESQYITVMWAEWRIAHCCAFSLNKVLLDAGIEALTSWLTIMEMQFTCTTEEDQLFLWLSGDSNCSVLWEKLFWIWMW